MGFLSLVNALELVGVKALLVTRFRFRDAAGAEAGEEALAGGDGDGRDVLAGTLMECADVSSLWCFLQ